MSEWEGDYLYEVWRHGGNPDTVRWNDIPSDFDWVWDIPDHCLPKEAHDE